MRGISGSGKSTVASKLSLKDQWICSTDSYFMVNGEYKFDASKLGYYHKCNFELFTSLLVQEVPVVVVDNTNTTRKEFKNYIDKATELGYEVFEIKVGSPWKRTGPNMKSLDEEYVEKCWKRNAHQVPFEVVRAQAHRFED